MIQLHQHCTGLNALAGLEGDAGDQASGARDDLHGAGGAGGTHRRHPVRHRTESRSGGFDRYGTALTGFGSTAIRVTASDPIPAAGQSGQQGGNAELGK